MPGGGDLSHIDPVLRRRIETTTSIRITDRIEKVPEAGTIREMDGQQVQVMHNGVVVEKDCYGGPWMTEVISRLRGHHEPQEEIAFAAVVDRLQSDTSEPVMLELGSFWAYYSLWVKHQIPSSTVMLVEPDPVNLEVGVRNFALNGLAPSAAIQAAVGAEHGRTIEIPFESDPVLHPVRSVTVDGLVRDQGLPRVDLVLCDVQGAEDKMLAGARSSVRDGRVRFVVISTHWSDTDPLKHQTCRSEVERLGGHIISEHSLPESCSGDGLIVASFDPRDRDMRVEIPIVRSRDSEVGELEWVIARRSGVGGVVWGGIDLIPTSIRDRLGATRLGTQLHHRLVGHRKVG